MTKLNKNQITWELLTHFIFPFEHEYKLIELNVRDKFIKNLKADDKLESYKEESKNMDWYDFIISAFTWQDTPEGHDFWSEIQKYYDKK